MNTKNTHRTVTYYNIITRQIKGAVRGAGRSKRRDWEGGGEGGEGEGDREYGASSSIVGVFDICKTIWNSVLILGCRKLNSELCRVPVKLDPYT